MHIKAFPSGPFETNAYVASSPEFHQAIIIDPAPSSAAVINEYLTSQQLKPNLIILTHSHWDHIADVAALKKRYQIPVWVHPLDAPNLLDPGTDGLPCWIDIEGVNPDRMLNAGDKIPLGEEEFIVIHTPGHSPGGICLYCQAQNVLFSGDTLFKGTIGNLSFPTSQPELMWDSLAKLAKLPPKTRVFPGHGPATRIEDEQWLSNPRRFFE
jgi:hydroxyacylglutathione hydrolase